MSKELVISANRHETRVALIEEDQLVEVFYQREHEYSLAGSIHKGRVTRVLPGMQSAFVDIGLERDAFLYVSDFFEDNEEYDKVVSTAEEQVAKIGRGGSGGGGRREQAPQRYAAPVEAVVDAEPLAVAEAVIPANEGEAAPADAARNGRPDRGGDRGDRGGRGRRGRRRGRGRGQGFPESKYSGPVEASAEPPAELDQLETALEATVPESFDDDTDPIVLPGESLAKYRREPEPAFEPEGIDAADELTDHVLAEVEAAEVDMVEPEPARASEPEPEPVPEPEPFVEPEPEPEVALADRAPADESPIEAEAEAGLAEPIEAAASETTEEAEPEAAEPEAAAATATGDEVEPARIPQSLTATLREQGNRYPHRMSRRTRRRGRGGDRPPVGEADAVAPVAAEGQDIVEAPQPRAERPERGERNDRRDRNDRQDRGDRPDRNSAAPRPDRDRPPQPSIADLLKEGQEIIVQIAKEPLGQKGARITSYVALPGRYVVYMPTVDHVGVSRKIGSDEERLRLKRILQTHRQGMPGGFILRTAGEGRTEEELGQDMTFLYNLWMDIRKKAEKRKAPALIHHDLDVVQRILRDQLTSQFKNIWVDNEEMYERTIAFVERFQPALVSRVKLWTRETPIFDALNITSELEKALRPKVWLKSGGYIVINQTEALVAIDINTGKYVGKSNRLEDTIVKTNTDAVKEIVRQIRLRDLGGIIVVDFIDMDERKNRQKVMQALEEAMRADKAPNKILSFNDFGLVAITRKRVKQSLERTLCSPCPYCEGAAYVKSVGTVVGEILVEARKLAKALEGENVVLRVNPEVGKVLKSNKNEYLQEIEEILGGKTVFVQSDPLLHQEKFDLA